MVMGGAFGGGSGSSFGGGSSSFGGSSSGSSGYGSSGSSGFGSSSTGSSGFGSSGSSFGGAPIVGVASKNTKASIKEYKKQKHYNEWEFTYDPLSDTPTVGGGNTGQIGQPASSTTTPVGSPTFGQPTGPTGPASSPSPNTMPPETAPQ